MGWCHECRMNQVIFIFYFFIIQPSSALTCSTPFTPGNPMRNKTCPDFKANPSFIYCCTSKLPPTNSILKEKHGVYCCSLEDFEKEKQELANAELRNFLKEYLALIVFGSILIISILVIIVTVLCKKIPGCPMHRTGHVQVLTHSTDSPAAMYRPVDQVPSKMYEAPPPYECFVPPPGDSREGRDGDEWSYMIENEVNQARRVPPQIT